MPMMEIGNKRLPDSSLKGPKLKPLDSSTVEAPDGQFRRGDEGLVYSEDAWEVPPMNVPLTVVDVRQRSGSLKYLDRTSGTLSRGADELHIRPLSKG